MSPTGCRATTAPAAFPCSKRRAVGRRILRALAAACGLTASTWAAAELPPSPASNTIAEAPQFLARRAGQPGVERNATLVLQADTAKDGWADAYECDNVPADATVIVPPDSPRYRALQPIPPLAGPALAPQTPAPSCRGGQWRVFSTFGDADLVFEYGPLGTGNAGGPPLALSLRIKYGASGLRARATQDDLPAEVEFQAGPEECLVRALYRGQFTLRLNFQRAE